MARALMITCILALSLTLARAGDERPVVAVFNVEIMGHPLSRAQQEMLSVSLTGKLTQTGVFQVVPRSQLKKRLLMQKKKSHKLCYDAACQITLGQELAAQKTLATQILGMGKKCRVITSLYDLKKETTDAGAMITGGCEVEEIVASLDKAVDELTGAAQKTRQKQLAKQAAEAEAQRRARILAEWIKNRKVALKQALYTDARGGTIVSCSHAEFCHGNGIRAERKKDYFMAVAYYRDSCTGDYMKACNKLGIMYREGRGVAKDKAKAEALFHKACQGGEKEGCSNSTKLMPRP